MVENLTSFYWANNSKSDILNIVLHGSSKGIDSPFIEKIFQALEGLGEGVIAFNFPYLERGEEASSGSKLEEEIEELKKILVFANADKYKHVRLVGKSLGAIVASFYLKSLSSEEQKKYPIVVLGYVKSEGGIDLKSFIGKIVIIQGEKDQFGGIEAIKEDLKDAASKDIQYFEIKGADHSYRDPETREPKYEDEVIEILQKLNQS